MDRPIIFAHRGARRRARENTLEAFRLARALRADGVELDVRRTRDGVLVVHHDPAPPGAPLLASVPFSRLRAEVPWVPTLTEALDALAGMLVNIEVKNLPWEADFDRDERAAASLAALLRARGTIEGVLVSSFHLATVDRVRAAAPEVATALLFLPGADPREMADLAADHGHVALHPHLLSLSGPDGAEIVAHVHARGLRCNVWTVNDPDEMRRLASLGVDGLVTDVPEVARRVLG